MNRIGRAVLTGTELLTVDETIARIEAVTAEDVRELAQEHWQPGSLSAAAIGTSAETIRAAVGRLSPELARVPRPAPLMGERPRFGEGRQRRPGEMRRARPLPRL